MHRGTRRSIRLASLAAPRHTPGSPLVVSMLEHDDPFDLPRSQRRDLPRSPRRFDLPRSPRRSRYGRCNNDGCADSSQQLQAAEEAPNAKARRYIEVALCCFAVVLLYFAARTSLDDEFAVGSLTPPHAEAPLAPPLIPPTAHALETARYLWPVAPPQTPPVQPLPMPPPPSPVPPPPSPAPSLSPSSPPRSSPPPPPTVTAAGLSRRYARGRPSASLSGLGLLVHCFDGMDMLDHGELVDEPWLPCATTGAWCADIRDRISASIVNAVSALLLKWSAGSPSQHRARPLESKLPRPIPHPA